MNKNNQGIKERIFVEKPQLNGLECQLSLELHVRRYAFARQYVSGLVLDVASGCGYGTYLLQKNPDVSHIVGVDVSQEAIAWAQKHFQTDKTEYLCSSIDQFTYSSPFDVAVCLETIEHLKEPRELVDLFQRNGTKKIILSFPVKKSTHYNPYHFHDFTLSDIEGLFSSEYKVYDTYEYFREFMFVFLAQKTIAPALLKQPKEFYKIGGTD